MLYSRSVEYAIRALGSLAELPEGSQKMCRLLAEEERIPAFFLAKTLQTLARQGMLRSAKGPTGGFALNRPAKKIRLWDVIEALDGIERIENGMGELPRFGPVRDTIQQYLKGTTIADVAARRRKRRSKSKPPLPEVQP
ncbi:MAG: Rrf2 family transcriptional regulator [Acidobacteria bacterium]|nr:Rrf2 family transcriptional regulator [Acidobacteriota bacterium]